MGAPLPTALPKTLEGARCYGIDFYTLQEVACKIAPFIPGVCGMAQAGVETALALLGVKEPTSHNLAGLILAECCPFTPKLPPDDPPLPSDYTGTGLKSPSEFGTPTPLVGGCNCTGDPFEEEVEEAITGNVSTYRP